MNESMDTWMDGGVEESYIVILELEIFRPQTKHQGVTKTFRITFVIWNRGYHFNYKRKL